MYVVDSSAVIALLRNESANPNLKAIVPQASITSVNLSEVVDRFARDGNTRDAIETMIAELDLDVIIASADLAYQAGMLRPVTSDFGLSLGDRFCLALAMQLGFPLVTTDERLFECTRLLGFAAEFAR